MIERRDCYILNEVGPMRFKTTTTAAAAKQVCTYIFDVKKYEAYNYKELLRKNKN
jgi:nucleoside-triphosphatase THEP1